MLDLKIPLVLAGIKGFGEGDHGFLGFARIRTGNGKGEYGGLSTAQRTMRLSVASVEMTIL
jgi:hypothetical protein